MKITIEKYNELSASGNAVIVGQCTDDHGIVWDVVNNYLDQRTDHCIHLNALAWMYTPLSDYMTLLNQ